MKLSLEAQQIEQAKAYCLLSTKNDVYAIFRFNGKSDLVRLNNAIRFMK